MSRKWRYIFVSLVLGVDSLGWRVHGQAIPSNGVSVDEAIRLAEGNEPSFATAAAERRATELERKDAKAALLPSAVYHNQYLFTQSNRTAATTTQGGVSQPLPIFIANNAVHEYYSQGVVNETIGLAQVSSLRLASARAALASAELEIARRGLVAAVVGLYFGLEADEEKQAVAQRALLEAERFVELTRKRERSREVAHSDVIKAQLQQEQRQRELGDARIATERARLELGVLLFADPARSYTLEPGALPDLPEQTKVENTARANNPELRSALASLQLGKAQVTAAEAALLPDLGLNFTYGIDAPQFARYGPDGARNLGYSASATVDVPLWDWFTSVRKVKEARIRADVAQVTLNAAQRRLIANLAEFYAEADIAHQQLVSLGTTVLDARESLRLLNLRYVDGEGTVLEVVDAQNTLIAAETAQADGVVRYRLALAQLETLTGVL